MIEYLINNRLVNPISRELFKKCEDIFAYFNVTVYMEEINELLENLYVGDNIHGEVLSIFETNIRNVLSNFGIEINDNCSMSRALDIIMAIVVLENIDPDLKETYVTSLDAEDNIEALENLLMEHFIIIDEDLHYLIDYVDDDFIIIMKEFLSTDTSSDHELQEIYLLNTKRKMLESEYDIKVKNLQFLREVSSYGITDDVIVEKFKDFEGTTGMWAIRTLIAVTFMNSPFTESVNRLLLFVPEEHASQVKGFVNARFNG